ARLGSVSWRVGRLTWQWDRAGDPWGVYLVCSAHRASRELMGGGTAFAGGLTGATSSGLTASAPVIASADAGDESTSDANPVPIRMPPSIDLHIPSLSLIFDQPIFEQPMFEQPIALTVGGAEPFPEFSEPIGLDPADMAAVPEPGTLLLM